MRNRFLAGGLAVLAAATLAAPRAAAQSKSSIPAKTPDGKPNLAGIYSFSTITPLQRPDTLAGKDTLSAEEAAAFEASENKRLNRDLFDPEKGQPSAGYAPRAQGGVLSYNEFWYERGSKLTKDKRTSLIVDPPRRQDSVYRRPRASGMPNGRGCPIRASAIRTRTGRSPTAACMGFNSGPPMTPGAYNNNVQILQAPGLRRDCQRDGAQRPHHPDRRPSARPDAPVGGRLARPLGRRDARGRDDQLPPRDEPAGFDGRHAADRTLHAHGRRHDQVRIHGDRSGLVHAAVERDGAAARIRTGRSSSTPATRATTRCRTSSPAPARRRRLRPGSSRSPRPN